MNYSHDNWSAILAHIGKPEELDTSARNAGALTRRREIRDAATLLRLGLAYGPGGMSLREVTAWANKGYVFRTYACIILYCEAIRSHYRQCPQYSFPPVSPSRLLLLPAVR